MEERNVGPVGTERPLRGDLEAGPAPARTGLDDPRALTILTTEHWSLLTARSLVYNEAFSRTAMFLTFLTGTLVALGFVSQGSGYTSEFLVLAVILLGFDLFIGLATLGRLISVSAEDLRSLQAMNRLRHAYLEMVPTLDRYVSTSTHDSLEAVLSTYGPAAGANLAATGPSPIVGVAHALTTTVGMVGVISAAVGGALGAALALFFGASAGLSVIAGVVAFLVLLGLISAMAARSFADVERSLEVRFPPPSRPDRSDR